MGKIKILTKSQEIVLRAVAQSAYLKKEFYFTGGTALSAVYLGHRYSDDLDIFTQKDLDVTQIRRLVSRWSKQYYFRWRMVGKERVLFFSSSFLMGVN